MSTADRQFRRRHQYRPRRRCWWWRTRSFAPPLSPAKARKRRAKARAERKRRARTRKSNLMRRAA